MIEVQNASSVPFFSIVVPVYNRPDHLKVALNSILTQTFEDFECLVIDDGSDFPEANLEIVKQLFDSRISYHLKENGGACKARNLGIELSKGRYIALLDSDDYFLEGKLQKYYELLKDKHNQEVFCFSQLLVDRGAQKKWVKPSRGLHINESMDEYLMCTHGWAQTSTQVISSSLAKETKFDENLPSSQDTDFAIRCCFTKPEVIFIKEPLINMNDIYEPNRVSKQKNHVPLESWLISMKGKYISDKAYWAYRGWHIARIISYGNRLRGVMYYFKSIIHMPYGFKMSFLIFLQIAIPQTYYQKLASFIVRHFGEKA